MKKKQLYFNDYYLNQKIYNIYIYSLENYDYFIEFNEYKKFVNYRIHLKNKHKYKKAKLLFCDLKNKYYNEFSSIYEALVYFKENQKIIRVDITNKTVTGFIMEMNKEFFLLQLIDLYGQKDGIMICYTEYIDSIYWDGEENHRLERLAIYSKLTFTINDVIARSLGGETLCEIYHSGFNTFMLGKCLKLTDDYFLIETINALGDIDGFVLMHSGLVDFVCVDTKYIRTYSTSHEKISLSSLTDFFDFVIKNNVRLDIITENKKKYKDICITSYDNENLFIVKNKMKKVLSIEKIDILDTCNY